MFLKKDEDIALMNSILETYPDMHPYFLELFLYAYLYKRELLMDLLEKHKDNLTAPVPFENIQYFVDKVKEDEFKENEVSSN